MNTRPYRALTEQNWFKFILGASFQDLPQVEVLSAVWSLAGVSCIDCCADRAVLSAVERGFVQAQGIASSLGIVWVRPWVMISLKDGLDPHFRKALFDPQYCPTDCTRPCERICPTQAIDLGGVHQDLCYGCGRCQPVCPLGLIEFLETQYTSEVLAHTLAGQAIDALEIHTHVGNLAGFERLWHGLTPLLPQLKLLSISFPDHPDLREYLWALHDFIAHTTLYVTRPIPIVWQTDGLPMSGDLGKARAKAAVALAQKVLSWELPGYVQLAGGTNQHSLPLAQEQGLPISGIAYGSYARKRVQEVFMLWPADTPPPEAWLQAVAVTRELMCPIHLPSEVSHGQRSPVATYR